MENNKLICPVKRLNKTSIDLDIDFQEDDMNIKLDITTKNVIKSAIDFIKNKINKEDKKEE